MSRLSGRLRAGLGPGIPPGLSQRSTRLQGNTREELGLEQAPRAGTRLDFSLLVNNDDGAGRHGLQWFFGIHGHRGEYERMGSLWLQ